MKDVLILGATGSIGVNAVKVLEDLRLTHRVVGLACCNNADLLVKQALKLKPKAVGITNPKLAPQVKAGLTGTGIEVLTHQASLCGLIELLDPDTVLIAVSGATGLLPSLKAARAGKRLALANKESLVMAGRLLIPLARKHQAEIIPVDSEHSAIFQSLRGERLDDIHQILLTASGGPFVDLNTSELHNVTPEKALKHPTWSMGSKITIDSATMMNKALEIIEARWLFNLPVEKIKVLVHRQSIIHSMVEFNDGAIIGQMGAPDMKVPIRFALTFPNRSAIHQNYFNIGDFSRLTFEEPDMERFPAIGLGFLAAKEGGLYGAVLNAANEAAVDLFLKRKIPFDEITTKVENVLNRSNIIREPSLEEILSADRWAREEVYKCV